jgi:hypothetical protein
MCQAFVYDGTLIDRCVCVYVYACVCAFISIGGLSSGTLCGQVVMCVLGVRYYYVCGIT